MRNREEKKSFHGSLASKLSSSSGKYLIGSFRPGGFLHFNYKRIGRLLIFFSIFYTAVVFMSLTFWWMFSLTLNPRTPTLFAPDSLIGTNPGLGFRPLPATENVLSSLISYQGTSNESFYFWTKSLIDFLDVYKRPGLTPGRGQNIYNCRYDRLPGPGQVCDVDVRNFGPCTEENYFMYHEARPCIFLKLNKIYGWRPKFYTDPKRLPKKMPEQLKNHITNIANSADPTVRLQLNTVWITCRGETPADAEFIGPIDYHPIQGFPGYFFPYENSEGYLSPLVAVHFKKPARSIVVNIECRAWAENIEYDRKDRQGSVHFELMID